MSLNDNHFYRFGEYRLDAGQRVIERDGKPVPLAPKVFDTLLVLVQRRGRIVEKEELLRLIWPDTFVEDANITFNIQQIRRALGDNARQPAYVETVARRGYRFIAPVEETTGFEPRGIGPEEQEDDAAESEAPAEPVHLVQAASLPKVKETERREKAADPIRRARFNVTAGQLAAAVAAIVVVLAAGGWLLWRRETAKAKPAGGKVMLAVLPFRNLTGDAGQDYFSDGLTEELITQLGSLDPQHLGAIALTSVMRYKNSAEPLDQIGRELGVDYVVEGSVRRDQGRVLVDARLVQARSQTPLWSREYDREAEGILALQQQIGQEVAGQVRLALGEQGTQEPVQQPAVSDQASEAHDLYLKGQFQWNKRTYDGFQQALGYFRQAIEKDPTYAPAYVGLADTYALMGGYSMRPQTEYIQQARAAAQKALELDSSSAEAHTALALIVQNYDWDWDRSEQEFRRAIELNPNYPTAHHWYAEHLTWLGRFDEALQESEQARRLDPFSLIIATDRGATLYYARRYDQAIEQLLAVRAVDPNFSRVGSILVASYEQKGASADALADLSKWQPQPGVDAPVYWATVAYAEGRAGEHQKAKDALAKLVDINRRQEVDAAAMVWACLGAGEQKQALDWLERAHQQHSNAMTSLKVEPRLDPLRSDRRFQDLLRKVGLA